MFWLEQFPDCTINNTTLVSDIINIDEQESLFLSGYNINFSYFVNYFSQLISHLKTIVKQYNKTTLLIYSNNLLEKKKMQS